jgi:hypothetical protein
MEPRTQFWWWWVIPRSCCASRVGEPHVAGCEKAPTHA